MLSLSQTLLFMFTLVLANGLFAAAEIAVVSVRKSRIRQLIDEGNARAKVVGELHDHAEPFLATVQVGVTVVSALGAAVGGNRLAGPLAEALRAAGPSFLATWADDLALAAVVVGFSFLSLILGELVPKSLAMRYAEPVALRMARPLRWMGKALRPAVWLLTTSANLILKPFRDRTTFTESRMNPEEIKLLVDEAAKSGAIEKRRAEIIERAVDFGDLSVADVLVPRSQMVAIDVNAGREESRRIILEEGHTRMPVIDGSLDKVIGYITARDFATLAWEQDLVVLQDIIRPAFFVPLTMRAVDLLVALQKRHEHLAIVVDEYGGTAGLATTEDLVEEIVGELFSEDSEVPEVIKRQADGSALVQATLPVREFNREFEADVPEDSEFDTVAGLLTHLAGAIPTANQKFKAYGFEFTVTDRTERRVKQVRVRRVDEPERE